MSSLIIRRLAWSAGIFLVAVLVIAGVSLLWMRGSLPRRDGQLRVPGLDQPVEILRDGHGVPHIQARSERDAYFALGFVHAQDRLWQMDFMRRLGAGRLSEILGAVTVPNDRFMRTLGLYRLAEASLPFLAPPVRAALKAYASGVNAYLKTHEGAWPPEFNLLGYRPEPWRPADSLVWGRLMAFRLESNWRDELLRARLLTRLRPDQISDLWPSYPAGSRNAAAGDLDPVRAADLASLPLDRLAATIPKSLISLDASNSWAVPGSRTASGKPVLANDTHLGLAAPGVWYLVRIDAPGLTLAGVTAPGVPLVVAGHNDRIAWGLTTTHSDTQDLFIERVDDTDPSRYLTPQGPRPFILRQETIAVKGGGEVRVTVRATRHGPVISDAMAPAEAVARGAGKAGRRVLALADVGMTEDDRTAEAIYRLNHARDWPSFLAALRDFRAPQQNITYADTAGNIGFLAPGRVPVRRAGDGRYPVPGWDGAHDWTGFLAFDQLPRRFNPKAGPKGRPKIGPKGETRDESIVTANNRIVTKAYPHFLSAYWFPPYRARRIHQLVDRATAYDADRAAADQGDVVSLAARDLLPLLLAAPAASARAGAAKALLARWDGRMARNRPEPLIYSAWVVALGRGLYGDELGPLFANYGGPRPFVIEHMLTAKQAWCDDITTAATETCKGRIADALDKAVTALSAAYGTDMKAWRWGRAHRAQFRHPVLGRVAGLAPFVNLEIATDGDDDTINRGSFRVKDGLASFPQIHGPTLRAVYDLAKLDDSRFMIVPGQSGNPLSPRYRDLLTPWRDGAYLRLGPAGTDTAHRLTLVPAAVPAAVPATQETAP